MITKKIVLQENTAPLMIRIEKYEYLFLVLILVVIIFFGLGETSLVDYDEGIYSEVAREMVENNDWLTMTFGGLPWFEKPPAYIWATALLFKLFGVNEFWARAVSGFSSVVVVLLTYRIGSSVFGRRVGILSTVPLITSYEFLRQSRNGTTDVTLTLFLMMALAAYITGTKRKKATWYFLALAFALGFMVKSWAAMIVILAIGINILIDGEVRDTLGSKHFWGAVLVALLVILPWHLSMYILHGQSFIDRYVVYDLLTRSADALEGNTGSTSYYLNRMANDYAPWFFVLPVALTVELKRVLNNGDRTRTLFIFAGCLFGIYSLVVNTKLFHYLTPLYPILAIFIANVIVKAYDDHRTTAFNGLVVAALVAMVVPSKKVLAIYLILICLMWVALVLIRYVTSRKLFLSEVESQKKLQGNTLITEEKYDPLAWVRPFSEKEIFPKLLVIQICIFLMLPGALRSRLLYKVVETPVEQIATVAGTSRILRDETIIALALPPDYENGIVGPAAMFYSERPIEVAWTEEQLSVLTSHGSREIIMGESFVDLLEAKYEFGILARRSPFIYAVIQQAGDTNNLKP